MRETAEYRKIKEGVRALRQRHKADPRLHDWVPARIISTGPEAKDRPWSYSMELACRCGMWVWVDAEEVRKF